MQNRTEFPGEFAAEKPKVEAKLRENKVQLVLEEADRAYRSRVKAATRKLAVSGGVKQLPEDWASTRPTMESLAQDLVVAVENATKIKMPLPAVTVRAAEFIPLDDLRNLGPIGYAQFSIGGRQGSFPQLVARTHELDPADSGGPQVGVPYDFPVVDSTTRDVSYFTVLDAKGESPAESLDEVRADVVRDVKLTEAYEKLKTSAPTYQALAVTDGLEGVARLFETPPAAGSPPGTPATPLPIDRRVVISKMQNDFRFPQLDDQGLRDAVLATLHTLGPDTRPTPENLVLRTIYHMLPSKLSLAVIQITGQRPLAVEDMRLIGDREVGALQQRELRDALTENSRSPFSYAAMKNRLMYKPAAGEKDPAGEQPAEETAPS